MFMGRKCLRKRNIMDSFCYFHSINVSLSALSAPIDLSVNRVNAIGENSNFSSRQNFIVRHPFRTTCFSAMKLTIQSTDFFFKIIN